MNDRHNGFHESFDREEPIAGPSERAFGLTVGAILGLIALGRLMLLGRPFDRLNQVLVIVSGTLILLALVLPRALSAINRAWLLLGLVLHRVINPILLGVMFLLAVSTIGLLLRLLGKRPLHLKWSNDVRSYWINRDPPGPLPASMKDQF